MKIGRSLLATTLLAVVVAATVVAVAAAAPSAARQRVAIDGKVSSPESGTFTFVPLTSAALKKDSGKVISAGNNQPPPGVVRSNGQTVWTFGNTASYTGANGTLKVLERLALVAAGRNYNVVTGTWKVISGTGAYEGFRGGGTVAAVQSPSGTVFFHEEGYLTKP